jgi:hypothetical protein
MSGTVGLQHGILTIVQDSSTSTLVSQIKAASDLGIRVSFGFLDASASVQDPLVLGAVMRSGGRYATITDSASAQDFIKLVLVNGLTTNDNPSGSQDILLGGLSVSKFISGSDTVTISYNARSNESIVFSVQSVDAGTIKAQASLNGKVVDKGTSSFSSTTLTVAAPNGGKIDIAVQAQSAPKDSIVVVGAVSNLPSQNCTVGIGGGGGNKVAKSVGLGLGLPALFAVIGAGCYFFYKHFYGPKTPAGTHGTPTYVGDQVPSTVPPAEKLVEPFVQQFSSVPPMVPPPKGSPPKNQTSDNDNPDKNTDEADPDDSDYEEGDNHDTNDLPSNPNNPNNQTPNQHNKIYRPKTFKLKACECLKCVTCYDCTSDCGFECRPNQDNFNCGEKCKINCTHEGDCFEDKAHDTHRHRCHRCEKHNKKARREEAIKKSVASIAVAAVKTAVHAAI